MRRFFTAIAITIILAIGLSYTGHRGRTLAGYFPGVLNGTQ